MKNQKGVSGYLFGHRLFSTDVYTLSRAVPSPLFQYKVSLLRTTQTDNMSPDRSPLSGSARCPIGDDEDGEKKRQIEIQDMGPFRRRCGGKREARRNRGGYFGAVY